MNKIIVIILSILLIFSLLLPKISSDEPIRGTTLYVGGTGPGNYTTIQEAINNSYDGYTVIVYSGTYYENIVVNKSINLIGESKNNTIIDGESEEIKDTITVSSDCVNISNFTIMKNNKRNAGIKIFSRNVRIFDNKIDSFRFGINVWNTSDNFIFNNELIRNTYGISLEFACNNNIIVNNSAFYNFIGIRMNSYYPYDVEKDNLITSNYISDNERGIYVFDNNNSTIKNNYIINNGLSGITIWSSSNIIIERNIIEKNKKFGVNLVYSSNVLVKENNFMKNKIQAGFLNPNLNDNVWEYNYWSNWRLSYPKIIFGLNEIPWWLTSIIIPWFDFDWNPTTEPYDIDY